MLICMNTHYDHYNRAMGKHIKNKSHYKEEMKRGGYISYEECQDKARQYKEKRANDTPKLSEGGLDFIKHLNSKSKDKKGNIKLSDGEIDHMKKMGVSFDHNPNLKSQQGGFI